MKQNQRCGQSHIPTVDNSEIECHDFIPSTCIYIKGSGIRGRDRKYPNLDEYILNQEAVIRELQRSNIKLKEELNIIRREFNNILGEFRIFRNRIDNLKTSR